MIVFALLYSSCFLSILCLIFLISIRLSGSIWCFCFFLNDTATTEIYTYRHTRSRHDALPISPAGCQRVDGDYRTDGISRLAQWRRAGSGRRNARHPDPLHASGIGVGLVFQEHHMWRGSLPPLGCVAASFVSADRKRVV